MDMSKAGAGGIVIDPIRFNQIFINLLSNAIKFTPKGGKVIFSIEELEADEKEKVIKRFIVKDNGIGMSKAFIPHAFESFKQEYRKGIQERYQGTGLGLTIVQNLVKLMGGTIQLESELDKGTTFIIYLPLVPIDLMENVPKVRMTDYRILSGVRILLAEDNDLNTEIAVALLKKHGCIVECAQNGSVAYEKFKESSAGYYRIILMDIRMPIMDGLEATRQIRMLDRTDAKLVPIIAMTADAFNEDEQISLEAGMNAHIPKPVAPRMLFDVCSKFVKKYLQMETEGITISQKGKQNKMEKEAKEE